VIHARRGADLLAAVTPHTLRHAAATWPMQRGEPVWNAAGFLGISAEMLMGRRLTLKVLGKKRQKTQRLLGRKGRI
jgi:integrase